ncbi:MAG: TonB-dependent receptor [Bacteroidetes bacterium]|nr:TonB-dependent receptor [Bacteroidota bacterium]MBS1628438.1 TonB-dependent receptor [Bacteroidota bacterium]
MKQIILAILALGVAGALHAQTTEQMTRKPKHKLSAVEVKDHRQKTAKERAEFQHHAQSTEVLTEAELNRNNPAFVEQALNTVAGVQVDKRTQLGGQRIVIRGYGNDQKFNNWGIKVYYDGIPLTTADGVTTLDDIDFTLVDNVEIIKGPAATEYGAGVGGVARFYLLPSTQKGTTLSENFTAGSFDLVQTSTRLDMVTDKSAITANYTHLQSNGYRPHGATQKNYFSSFGNFKISDKQSLSYFVSHNASFDEVSGQISYASYYAGEDPGNQAYIKKNGNNNTLSNRAGITHRYAFNKHFSNWTTLFYSNSDYHRVSAGAESNGNDANYGLRSTFNLHFGEKNWTEKLDFGTELQESGSLVSSYRFTGTNDTIPLQVRPVSSASYLRYNTDQSSFFAINRIGFKPWGLTLVTGIAANNIQYRRTDLFAGPGLIPGHADQSFEKHFSTSINPHIALQKLWKNQIFQFSYSEGYNAPTASSAFISGINKPNDSLLPEKGRMYDFSIQGLLFHSRLDYQFSIFRLDVDDKLTQLSAVDPQNKAPYTYFANTGTQRNQGIELSLGYLWALPKNPAIATIEPFFTASWYDFSYRDFKTKSGTAIIDYSSKQVIGVPRQKYCAGLDFNSPQGFYLNSTFYYLGEVYADFGNTNQVGSYTQLNAKIGYRHSFALARHMPKRFDLDLFFAGNNLANQINYTYLFVGNAVNDSDPGSGFPAGVSTDVTPGPSLAYFFGGIGLKYRL